MSGRILEAKALEAGYGALQILFGVDIHVDEGEHVLVFGPNGAGKSTLIKALFGLASITGGTVAFRGRDVSGWAPERLVGDGLAYVPQVSNVFSSMTVFENLEMGGSHLDRAKRAEGIGEMLELFPILGERRSQAAGTLSGGERQMLALARALVPKPDILLLDEPSAGVAPILVEEIFQLVSSLRRTGVSVLMIEQNARQALPHVDRGYVLESGQVRLSDTATKLLENTRIGELYLGQETDSA